MKSDLYERIKILKIFIIFLATLGQPAFSSSPMAVKFACGKTNLDADCDQSETKRLFRNKCEINYNLNKCEEYKKSHPELSYKIMNCGVLTSCPNSQRTSEFLLVCSHSFLESISDMFNTMGELPELLAALARGEKNLPNMEELKTSFYDFLKNQNIQIQCFDPAFEMELYCQYAFSILTPSASANFLKKINRVFRSIPSGSAVKTRVVGTLGELIPVVSRNKSYVVEVQRNGHFDIRYFDPVSGEPMLFEGSPFNLNRINKTDSIYSGVHFVFETDEAGLNSLIKNMKNSEGKLSLGCTKTACDALKADGINLSPNKFIPPGINDTYQNLNELAQNAVDQGSLKKIYNTNIKENKLNEIFSKTEQKVKYKYALVGTSWSTLAIVLMLDESDGK